LSDVREYTLRQFSLFVRAVAEADRLSAMESAVLMRAAVNADKKDFQKFLDHL
jgi:hypothetical protein